MCLFHAEAKLIVIKPSIGLHPKAPACSLQQVHQNKLHGILHRGHHLLAAVILQKRPVHLLAVVVFHPVHQQVVEVLKQQIVFNLFNRNSRYVEKYYYLFLHKRYSIFNMMPNVNKRFSIMLELSSIMHDGNDFPFISFKLSI